MTFQRHVRISGLMAALLLLLTPLPFSPRLEAQAPRRLAAGDVVINEVAWMGTAAHTADEWIELYNVTAQGIDLTGWTLKSADASPNLTLSGSIPAHGFFLLERTNDTTVSDITADQIYTGDLINAGESLTLRDSSAQVIDTANGDGGDWPAGDNTNKSTMERCDPLVADADANWASNDGITRNGLDANGAPLNGTPKARNSAYVEPPPPAADLRATKTGPATASIGDTVEYSLSLYNDGQLQALASRLTDTLPSGVSFVAGSPPPTQQSGQSLVWVLGDLAPGAHQQLTVTGVITVGAPALLVNRSARAPPSPRARCSTTPLPGPLP